MLLAALACAPAPDRGAPDRGSAERTAGGNVNDARQRGREARQELKWPPPGFPVVEGDQPVTDAWAIHLPGRFARRVEDGSLVFWRPGLTVWLTSWKHDGPASQALRLRRIKEIASPRRFAERESTDQGLTRYSYRLKDESDDGPVDSVYGYVLGESGDLQLAVYFDRPADEAEARRIVDSVTHREP